MDEKLKKQGSLKNIFNIYISYNVLGQDDMSSKIWEMRNWWGKKGRKTQTKTNKQKTMTFL